MRPEKEITNQIKEFEDLQVKYPTFVNDDRINKATRILKWVLGEEDKLW